jgi:Tol biopolymer transport system component
MLSTPLRSAALVAVLGSLAVPAAASAWPGLNGRIGLTQNPRTKDLYAFTLLGASTQLTFTGNDEQQPSWAPDGRRIAFKRSDEVFVRDVTSDAAPQRLTNKRVSTENNTQPAWSPDGSSIIFRTNRSDPTINVGDVWIMDADGTNERPLLVQADDQRYPTFSPDGSRISYTSRNEQGNADLWVANADGTGARMVYDSGRSDSAPAWSPDGTRLAFESGPELQRDLFVLDLGDGHVIRLTDHPAHDEGPAWSPDGTMLVFTSTRDNPPPFTCTQVVVGCDNEIYVMQADGTELTRLTANSILDESPDWQAIPTTLITAVACGEDIAADNERHCARARRQAAEWSPETPGCTRTPHSFGQELIECGDALAFVRTGG